MIERLLMRIERCAVLTQGVGHFHQHLQCALANRTVCMAVDLAIIVRTITPWSWAKREKHCAKEDADTYP